MDETELLASPWLQYGEGAFETLRVEEGQIPLLRHHRHRLSAALLAWGLDANALDGVWAEVEDVGSHLPGIHRLKLMVGRGADGRLLYHIVHGELKASATVQRATVETIAAGGMHHFKSTCYAPFIQAHRRALSKDASEALLLHPRGWALEFATSALIHGDGARCFGVHGPRLDSVAERVLFSKTGWFRVPPPRPEELPSRWVLACNALRGLRPVKQLILSDQTRVDLPQPPRKWVDEMNRCLWEG